MIIDAHSHVKIDENFITNINSSILSMKNSEIDKCVVSIDPFVKELKCDKDFYHFVSINDYNDSLKTHCHQCDKEFVYNEDPFQKYNKILLDNLNEFFIPFLTLPVVNNFIKDEIKNYQDYIYGLKIYTGLSEKTLDELQDFNFDFPLLIHTGMQNNQNPKNMLKFLKKYRGQIILAHYARFCPEVLDIIQHSPNIYIDTSPTIYLFKNYILNFKRGGLFDKRNINVPEDIYYKALELYGVDKIIFGTDYPFSDRLEEMNLIKKINLSKNDFEKITYGNIKKVLGGKI